MELTKLAAWGVAALMAVVAAARLLGGPSAPEAAAVALDQPAPAASAAAPEPGGPAPGAPGAGDVLHVHVAGAVRRPGLYRVPPGSRVAAAVEAAGGLSRRADPAGVNLAAALQDGQQVVVSERGRAGAGGGPAGSPASTAAGEGTISLSTATVEQLETLDGIGPALAARIIEYRDANGGFRSVDQLQEVEGIGEKRFAALRDAVQP
jgi:competence protein ComEA